MPLEGKYYLIYNYQVVAEVKLDVLTNVEDIGKYH